MGNRRLLHPPHPSLLSSLSLLCSVRWRPKGWWRRPPHLLWGTWLAMAERGTKEDEEATPAYGSLYSRRSDYSTPRSVDQRRWWISERNNFELASTKLAGCVDHKLKFLTMHGFDNLCHQAGPVLHSFSLMSLPMMKNVEFIQWARGKEEASELPNMSLGAIADVALFLASYRYGPSHNHLCKSGTGDGVEKSLSSDTSTSPVAWSWAPINQRGCQWTPFSYSTRLCPPKFDSSGASGGGLSKE